MVGESLTDTTLLDKLDKGPAGAWETNVGTVLVPVILSEHYWAFTHAPGACGGGINSHVRDRDRIRGRSQGVERAVLKAEHQLSWWSNKRSAFFHFPFKVSVRSQRETIDNWLKARHNTGSLQGAGGWWLVVARGGTKIDRSPGP